MLQLPFDIVWAVYDSLEKVDARHTLLNLLVLSKTSYAIFSLELYRRITIAATDPRIARLVKTLRKKPHLKNEVHALTIRLESLYAPPTTFRRVFRSVEPLEQFARLVAKGRLPNLRRLAFVGERGYNSFTHWTKFSQPTRDLFFRMRCLKTIRCVRFDSIEELDAAMVWGQSGFLALDDLQLSSVHYLREPFVSPQKTTNQHPAQPHLLKTLAIHTTRLFQPFTLSSFCHLESFSFTYAHGMKGSTVSDVFAIVDACKDTLHELHIQAPTPSVSTTHCFGTGPPPGPGLPLDLTKHVKLHTVVIKSTARRADSSCPTKLQAHIAAEEDLSAVVSCLTKMNFPPGLPKLRVGFHLLDSGDAQSQNLFDLFNEWRLISHFGYLYGAAMSMSPENGRVQQVEVGITPILPLQITCVQLRHLQLAMHGHLARAQENLELDRINFYLDFDTGIV